MFLKFIKLFTTIFLLMFSNTVIAQEIYMKGTLSFNKIEQAHQVFIKTTKEDNNSKDSTFNLYLKELNSQIDFMNKWNVQNVQNYCSMSEKKKSDLLEKCKKYNIKVKYSEIGSYFAPDYKAILKQNENLLSPQMRIWLEYLKDNSPLLDDAALCINIDDVRKNIINLENLINEYPDFIARQDVISALNDNAKAYFTNFDNSPMFDRTSGFLKKEYKASYEKFLSENTQSKYYKDFSRAFNSLKQNNFRQTELPKFRPKYESTIKKNFKKFFSSETTSSKILQAKNQAKIDAINYINYAFYDFNNISIVENGINIKNATEAIENDKTIINKKMDMFYKNKNNMSYNAELYSNLKRFICQYTEIEEYLESIYKKAYEDYKINLMNNYNQIYSQINKNNPSADIEKRQLESVALNLKLYKYEYFKSDIVKDSIQNQKIIEILQKTKSDFDSLASEVFDYSYNFEKNRTLNYMQNVGKKQNGGTIAAFIYTSSYYTPNKNLIYTYDRGSHPLYIAQVLNNGIMVRGDYSLGGYYARTASNIFIQTSKKYVANQLLQYDTYYAFTGIKKYNTVMGAQNAIWQFKELSRSEVKKNFSTNNTLYFYNNL